MDTQKYYNSFNDDLEIYQISLDLYKKIVSGLPDKKFYEYAYHSFFNPSAQFISWQPWDIWNYPVQDALRFDHVLLKNVQHFQNKSVLDLGCHLGYMSMIVAHLGASKVTGTNVRNRELEISREICTHAGFDNVTFKLNDITDLPSLSDLCNKHQTLLFSGLIYHLSNPYAILETMANSSAECLIIDNIELDITKNAQEPLIFYTSEKVDNSTDGYKSNSTNILVGIPNQAWIDFSLQHMGWRKTYDKSYLMIHNGKKQRRISTWTKL